MKWRGRLFRWKKPFSPEGSEELFLQAMKENAQWQYAHCPEYRRILEGFHFSPEQLKTPEDLERLPFLPTVVFKKHRLFSMPPAQIPIKATSSGTKGQFSEIGLDFGSLVCGLRMVLRVCRLRRLISPVPCHYIVLGYKPHRGNRTGVAKTAFGATLFTPALSRTYALVWRDGAYRVELDGVIQALEKHSRSRFPLRFMGFPTYAYFMMRELEDRELRLTLPKGSKLMLGGGWKQFYAQQVDKEEFYRLARETLGLADTDVVEFFGAVEHPILYCDCPHHHFHVPVYSRVIIRDPATLEPLPMGQPGLVQLMTPMVKAVPLLSVMTDDLGVLHPGESCPCGIRSPYLELLGRVGLTEVKTCAAGAAEMLKEVAL